MENLKCKHTILVAEDDSSNYRLAEILLKKDYTIFHAWDGDEAIQLYKQHKPQLVLMDINMPNMNGYEALAELKKLDASLPVIAVTAYAMSGDEEAILEAGFDAYLPKPININTFERIVSKYIK